MITPTKHTIAHIRSLYASGLYHKADLMIRFLPYLEGQEDLQAILNYTKYPEIRKDLQWIIFSLAYIFKASEEYHTTLRESAENEFESVKKLKDRAPATFEEDKKRAVSKLKASLTEINEEFDTTFTLTDVTSRLYRDF